MTAADVGHFAYGVLCGAVLAGGFLVALWCIFDAVYGK